jgi:cell division protein FtsQ
MFKEVNWKSVFKCFAWVVCLGGIITLMSFVEVKKHTVNCTNIKILIPGADNFIEREEIDAILKQNEGQLIGRNLEDINLHAIEQKIVANPYIAMATVYADMDGVIHIEISQRQPLLRIINSSGQDYYIDRNGLKMPVSPNFTANVLVANGHIMEHFGGKVDTLITKMAADLYKTALFLKKDTLWDAQIEQIFVNDKDDIELVPRVGNQRIILGTADSLATKMTNLLTFYKKAMPQVGWDTYKTINIKYTNQIVCEKNALDSLGKLLAARAPFRPTPASAKKVMDSLVKVEIANELKNNPEESAENNQPDRNSNPPVVIAVPKPKVIVKEKAPVKAKPVVTKTVEKKVVKPVLKATVKPAVKTEVKQTRWKPAEKKVTATETKKTLKPEVKTTTKATTEKKTWKPAAKEPEKAVVKKTTTQTVKKSGMPEIRWIKPVPKVVKPAAKKDTKTKK